ncbi:TCP-1/cpn60 chaperonin family protein, partial [Tanacetum coccineum]
MDYEEQKIGARIFKRALEYPARQIAKNGGVKGSVVIEKILSNDDVRYGYNDASNKYEDLMASDIIGPTKSTVAAEGERTSRERAKNEPRGSSRRVSPLLLRQCFSFTPSEINVLSHLGYMSADVTRGHGGDDGGDDRPPPHQIPTGCEGLLGQL